MEQHGIALGGVLLVLVITCGLLLARKAARSVQQFRADQHKRFLGKEPE